MFDCMYIRHKSNGSVLIVVIFIILSQWPTFDLLSQFIGKHNQLTSYRKWPMSHFSQGKGKINISVTVD